jgi:hypothetical protein
MKSVWPYFVIEKSRKDSLSTQPAVCSLNWFGRCSYAWRTTANKENCKIFFDSSKLFSLRKKLAAGWSPLAQFSRCVGQPHDAVEQ